MYPSRYVGIVMAVAVSSAVVGCSAESSPPVTPPDPPPGPQSPVAGTKLKLNSSNPYSTKAPSQ